MSRIRPVLRGALLGLMVGCGPTTGTQTSTVAPGQEQRPGPQPVGAHEGETSGELAARIGKLRVRQQSLLPMATDDPGVCEEVCSLATGICGAKEALCNLANERPQDDDYQRLCREAKAECRTAQDDCVKCVEGHTSGSSEERPPQTSGTGDKPPPSAPSE